MDGKGKEGDSNSDDSQSQSNNPPQPVALAIFHDDYEPENGILYFRQQVLSSFDDTSVRLSLSWKAKVFSDTKNFKDYQTGSGDISVSEAIDRFNAHLGSNFSDLGDDDLRVQLTERWSGYVV